MIAEGLLSKAADRFAVLGQIGRLRLVEQLAGGAATPQELAESLGLSQQNVSKHLGILLKAGVVTRRADGANAFYALKDESTVKLLEDVVASVLRDLRELSEMATGMADDDVKRLRGTNEERSA